MRSNLIAAAMATVMISSTVPAPLSAQGYQPARVIGSFDIDTLRAVVAELDGTVENNDGDSYLVRFKNGKVSKVSFTACRQDGCLGTHFEASFGKPNSKSESEVQNLVADFNKSNRTLKVYHLGNGRTMAEEYIIADGGITIENYKRQISLFAYILNQYGDTIYD